MTHTRRTSPLLRLLLALAAAACGGEDPLGPDEELADLVGTWRATRFQVTNVADPSVAPDIIDPSIGGSFTLDIQPSGQYTAILTLPGGVLPPQLGEMEREGSQLVLHVLEPCCRTDRVDFTLEGGLLTLRGPTEFDFNQDGAPEDATAVIELRRD